MDLAAGRFELISSPSSGFSFRNVEDASGGKGDDIIIGSDGANRLSGGLGNDEIHGGAGDDLIGAKSFGDDKLWGGSGNDHFGVTDGDIIYDIEAGDSVDYNGDRLAGGVGIGPDEFGRERYYNYQTLTGSVYYWAPGSTTLEVNGLTIYDFQNGDGGIFLGIFGTAGDDSLDGSSENDTLSGLGGNDTLTGGAGRDALDGGNGNDLLEGGSGSDVYLYGAGDGLDRIVEESGSADTIYVSSELSRADARVARLTGTNDLLLYFGADQSQGIILSNQWSSSAGAVEHLQFVGEDGLDAGDIASLYLATLATADADAIGGSWAGERVIGLDGDDTLNGHDGDDTLDGGAGADWLSGDYGHDQLFGGEDADTLLGQDGDDLLYGEAGDDMLRGGAGANLLDGGAGIDGVDYSDAPGAVTADLAAGTAAANGFGATDTFAGVENLTGSPYDDRLDGNAVGNVLRGLGGADLLVLSHGGDDVAIGDAGADIFYFGDALTAADRIDGGTEFDSVFLAGQYDLTLAADSFVSVEKLAFLSAETGEFDYRITTVDQNIAAGARLLVEGLLLEAGEDLVFLGHAETDGSFKIVSGPGDDVLVGGAKGDEIIGHAGADAIYGQAGADTITGGLGADWLHGGAGADRFLYAGAAESTGPGFDTHDTFGPRIDRIDLPFAVAGWSGTIGSGSLTAAAFDADLAAAVDAALQAHSAVLFTADAGEFAGRTFAVVDADGDGAYQAGQDYVFEFTNPVEPIDAFAIFV